ncbi:MAG: ABC-three component system protein [Pseudomonadota bacterium]
MSPQSKALARTLFKLKVHESNGFEFEHLFGRVMQYSRVNFTKIEPYGNQGDRGNDGYEKNEGRYFQVFAPKDPHTSKQAAIKKVASDFKDKLLPYWSKFCEPKEYFFAFNDKYQGTNFPIEKTLAELKKKHSLTVADVYLAKHLEQEFIDLKEDEITMVVSGIPDPNSISGLDYTVLGEVMRHVQNTAHNIALPGKLIAPDIDEKIQFNHLKQSGFWLKAKQAETWQIDEYFKRNSDFAKQALRDYLAGYYADSLIAYPDTIADGGNMGEVRFAAILENLAPASGVPVSDKLRRDAALAIMAKYFETCDIFEDPKNAAARQAY